MTNTASFVDIANSNNSLPYAHNEFSPIIVKFALLLAKEALKSPISLDIFLNSVTVVFAALNSKEVKETTIFKSFY